MYFLYPLFLILLLLPLGVLFYSIYVKKETPSSLFSPAILKVISLYPNIVSNSLKYRLFSVVIILFIVALARPVLQTHTSVAKNKTLPLVIALDISKSMLKDDSYPSTLEFALSKIELLLASPIKLRVALLLFANNAYVAHPLSEDKTSVEFIAKNIQYSKIVEDKTNLFAALEGANLMLKDYKSKNILILSDIKIELNLDDEYAYVKKHTLHVNILNITQEHSASLETLSHSSGGSYTMATYSSSDLESILHHLQTSSKSLAIQENEEHRVELFYFPLLVSLFLLLFIYFSTLEFKHKSTNLLILFLLSTLSTTQLKASPLDSYYIYKAQSAYEKGEYESAIKTYTKALTTKDRVNAKLYYNIANAYAKQKKLYLAKKYYKKSLALLFDEEAEENLKLVQKILSNQKHKKKKEKEDKYKLPQRISLEQKEPQDSVSSNYVVSLDSISEKKREKPLIFLRKLSIQKRSKNVLQDSPTKSIFFFCVYSTCLTSHRSIRRL